MSLDLPVRIWWEAKVGGRTAVFARAAFIKVKPGCKVELTRTFEQEAIPLSRKEKDLRGFVTIVPTLGKNRKELNGSK